MGIIGKKLLTYSRVSFLRRIFVPCLAFSLAIEALAGITKVHPSKSLVGTDCRVALETISKRMTSPTVMTDLHVSRLYEFGELLVQISKSKEKALLVNRALAAFEGMNLGNNLLAEVVDHYKKYKTEKNSTEILVCLVSSECHSGPEAIASLEKNYESLDFHNLGERHLVDAKDYLATEPKIIPQKSNHRVIGMRNLKATENDSIAPANFVANFFHEYRHIIDFELIDNWLNANQKLILANREPDKLFAKYVRVDPVKGIIVLDSSFMKIFVEGRATEVQYRAGAYLGAQDVMTQATNYLAHMLDQSQASVVSDLTERSEYQWTSLEQVAAEMNQSIIQAATLK